MLLLSSTGVITSFVSILNDPPIILHSRVNAALILFAISFILSLFIERMSTVNSTSSATIFIPPLGTLISPTVATVPSAFSLAQSAILDITFAATSAASSLISIGVVPAWSALPYTLTMYL